MFERPKRYDKHMMLQDTDTYEQMQNGGGGGGSPRQSEYGQTVVFKGFQGFLSGLEEDLECIMRVIWTAEILSKPYLGMFKGVYTVLFGRQSFDVQGQTTITLKEVCFGAKKTLRVPDTIVQDKDGKRKTVKGRDVVVDIPPGIEDGQRLRLHGQGIDPEVQGRDAGESIRYCSGIRHPNFERGCDVAHIGFIRSHRGHFWWRSENCDLKRGH